MRHKKLGRQFGRNTSHRRAMFRSLTANLILHERIETTEAKAKELRRVVDRLITKAVRLGKISYTPQAELSVGESATRTAVKRQIGQFLQRIGTKVDAEGESVDVDLIEKLMVSLTKRFVGRPGGYTRTIKLGRRRGDNAPMVFIEFVDRVSGSAGAGDKSEAVATESAEEQTASA